MIVNASKLSFRFKSSTKSPQSYCIAVNLSDKIPQRNSLNAISSFSERDGCEYNFLNEKNDHTKFALCTTLKSCSKARDLHSGMRIHARIIRTGYEDNIFLNTTLINLYSNCEALYDSRRVFDSMKQHDEVSWTSIISGLSQNSHAVEAFLLFKEMQKTDIKPNCITFSSILSACSELNSSLEQGKTLHAHVIKLGFDKNNFIISTLIDCYSKSGEMDLAILLFNSTIVKDIVICDSMLSGYSQNSRCQEALNLLIEMQSTQMNLSYFTLSIILNACGSLCILENGRQVHSMIIKRGFDQYIFVSSSLVDMYSKCGHIDVARRVFDLIPKKNSILWTCMITGYGQNGRSLEGLDLFEQVLKQGYRPDHVCFTSVLTACNHGGLVDEGVKYFNSMKDKYGLVPEIDQYACMVDLYGRNGYLQKAKDLILNMPFVANSVIWTSFLGFCRLHGEVKHAEEAVDHLLKLDMSNCAPLVTLANVYAEATMWDKVAQIRKTMRMRGMRKSAGWSWIEVEKEIHVFLSSDTSHPQSAAIYAALEKMIMEM